MDKFQRNYILYIEANDGSTVQILPPFTIDFSVIRNTLSSSNIASVRIYNLSEKTRSILRKDQFDYTQFRRVTLLAGYGANMPLIMSGNITQCFSVREGTNFITQIDSFDGGYAYSSAVVSRQYRRGTPYNSIVNDLADSLKGYGVEKGTIGQIEGETARGNSFVGNPLGYINEITGSSAFIDLGKISVLASNEVIASGNKVINSSTGLLSTPRREQSFLTLETLFEPDLFIGQFVNLQSGTASTYNGDYKVVSITHRGMISPSVSGSATTNIGLSFGDKQIRAVSNAG